MLGGSGFARRRSIPAMMLSPAVELLGVASRTREKSEKFAEQFALPKIYESYDHMLEDPDIEALHIPLPNSMHCEWTMKAMAKGKHVLVEKPFATNVLELTNVAMSMPAGLKVMEAMMWPFHPQHRKAKELIAQDAIGKVRFVRSSFSYLMTAKTGIRLDKELGGGCLLDVGCYPVSAARYYFEEEPTKVFARGDIHPELEVDTNLSGVLEFPSGRALFDAGYHLPYRTDLEVVGERGRIYFPRAWQPHETASIFLNEEEIVLPAANHYLNLFDHFSNAALNDTDLEFGVEDALKQMQVLDAIKCSILLE